MESQLTDLNLAIVIEECQRQTRLFADSGTSDARYCYELFRRAFGDFDADAFDAMYRYYKPQLERWAQYHPLINATNDSPEDFALTVLGRAWEALSGEQFYAKIHSLPAMLAFLKRALANVIIDAYRRSRREIKIPDDEGPRPLVDESPEMEVGEIWGRIQALCPEESDQTLILLRCVFGMKPEEIARTYPAAWADARGVVADLCFAKSAAPRCRLA